MINVQAVGGTHTTVTRNTRLEALFFAKQQITKGHVEAMAARLGMSIIGALNVTSTLLQRQAHNAKTQEPSDYGRNLNGIT